MRKFLTHIEALRGLAILMVVLFHLVPNLCPNGYYGVDIFLMISGYFLVSGIVNEKPGAFSLKEFVNKKVIRIFPPLLALLLIVLPVGLLIFPYEELLVSANTALASLYGGSNIFLDQETHGYFAGDSGRNLFMHTWYLSVIVQVYLIFALVAFLLKRCSGKVAWGAILLLGGISLGVVVYYRFVLPRLQPAGGLVPMYYWTWSRIFEVVTGAGILLLPSIRHKMTACIIQLLALVGVLFVCFSLNKQLELLLVCGGCLIWCCPEGRFGLLLNNPIFRFLGKYSFSIYLWHWPFIVMRNYVMETVGVWDNVLLFAVCIAGGIVAYYLFEKRRWKLWISVVLWGAVLGICMTIIRGEECIKQLNSELYEALDAKVEFVTKVKVEDYPVDVLCPWKAGTIGAGQGGDEIISKLGSSAAAPSFVMVGDSHARSFVPGMAVIAEKLNISGYYLPTYITPFHDRMGAIKAYRFSGEQAAALMDWLKSRPDIKHVVLVQRWSIRMTDSMNDSSMPLRYDGSQVDTPYLYEDAEHALREFCMRIKATGKKVIVMTEVPFLTISPAGYLRRALLHEHSIDKKLLTCSEAQYYAVCNRHLKTFYQMENNGLCGVISVHLSLIKNGYFDAFEDKKMRMDDSNHISVIGAKLYAEEHFEDWRPYLCPQTDSEQ